MNKFIKLKTTIGNESYYNINHITSIRDVTNVPDMLERARASFDADKEPEHIIAIRFIGMEDELRFYWNFEEFQKKYSDDLICEI